MNIVVTDRSVCAENRRRVTEEEFARRIADDHAKHGVLSAIANYLVTRDLHAMTGIRWPVNDARIVGRADRLYIARPTVRGYHFYISEGCKLCEEQE